MKTDVAIKQSYDRSMAGRALWLFMSVTGFKVQRGMVEAETMEFLISNN